MISLENKINRYFGKKSLIAIFLVLNLSLNGCESLNNSTIRNSEGVGYYTQGQYDQAIAVFQEAIELDPDNADAYYNLASTYQQIANQTQQSGLLVQAENYYRLCLEKSPSSETTICCYRGLATALNQRNQGDQALELLRQWETRNPNSVEPKLEIAYLLEAQGKYQDALNELQKVAVIAPNDYRSYYKMGVLNEKLGNSEAALNHYLMASRLNPSDAGIARNVSVLQNQIANGSGMKTLWAAQDVANKSSATTQKSSQNDNSMTQNNVANNVSSSTNNLFPSITNDSSTAINTELIANTQPEISFNKNEDINNRESIKEGVLVENARSELPTNQLTSPLPEGQNDSPSYATPLTNSASTQIQNLNHQEMKIPDGTGSSSEDSSSTPDSSSSLIDSVKQNSVQNNDSETQSPSFVASNVNQTSNVKTTSTLTTSPTRRNRIGEIGSGPPKINVGAPF